MIEFLAMNKYSPRQLIDDVVKQFTNATSSSGARLNQGQIRALLESSLRKLNLVTREEFDAQTAVLTRTRKKLQDLEEQVTNFEIRIKSLSDE